MRRRLLFTSLLLATLSAHAGVIINGTRVIFQGDKKEASLGISNPDAIDYLIQSWADCGDSKFSKAPFLITPPLFRLDAKQDNVLRVVRTGGTLPEDRESLFWLNVKAIPSSKHEQGVNTLKLAINTRIKLMYRPGSIKGKPVDVADKLQWHREGHNLVVNNPTPFYMNFQSVTLNGRKLAAATWASPKTESRFAIPENAEGTTVTWSIINDFGSVSKTWTQSTH